MHSRFNIGSWKSCLTTAFPVATQLHEMELVNGKIYQLQQTHNMMKAK